MLRVDKSLKNWTQYEWLRGISYDGYEACMKCIGDEKYTLDIENPELCRCEEVKDMIKPNGSEEDIMVEINKYFNI